MKRDFSKFNKNKKQKSIIIGAIIGILLIIGGITLYKSYALFKVEKEFNVLKGVVPEFSTNYKEKLLNGADPVVKEGLVPVTIDNQGVVRKANVTSEWYSYEKKNWANAVILKKNSYDLLNEAGKVYGATKKDGYVHFDGVDDYIDLGLENYDFGSSITMAIRVRFNELKSRNQEFFGNWEGAGGGCVINASGKLYCDYYIQEQYYMNSGEVPIEKNQFYTVVSVYDGTELSMYIDGQLVKNKEVIGTLKPSIMPIMIGANPNVDTNTNFVNIDVTEAAIFDRALSQEEIERGFMDEFEITNSEGLLRYVDFTSKEYKEEEIIPEDAIESYFVWVPKYSYQLWDLGNYDSLTDIDTSKEHSIPIKFGTENTVDSKTGECTTPMNEEKTQGLSGESGNCVIGDYMTHPAFISMNTSGLWVGKFETGYKGATTPTAAQVNVEDASKVVIKPNVYSWSNINVSNAFYTSYNYLRDLDSHMMKNTEWGAVAYLTNSKYGRCEGSTCEEVRINNNSNYITGYAAKNQPTTGYTGTNEAGNIYEGTAIGVDGANTYNYKNPVSQNASSTGNYSGIYDLSGGSWEYVMGVMLDQKSQPISGRNASLNSGFKGVYSEGGSNTTGKDFPTSKYYDAYIYNTNNKDFVRRIYGDATGELGPFANITYGTQTRQINSWYKDESSFAVFTYPWIVRGGFQGMGSDSGVFSFNSRYGSVGVSHGFRIILVI